MAAYAVGSQAAAPPGPLLSQPLVSSGGPAARRALRMEDRSPPVDEAGRPAPSDSHPSASATLVEPAAAAAAAAPVPSVLSKPEGKYASAGTRCPALLAC